MPDKPAPRTVFHFARELPTEMSVTEYAAQIGMDVYAYTYVAAKPFAMPGVPNAEPIAQDRAAKLAQDWAHIGIIFQQMWDTHGAVPELRQGSNATGETTGWWCQFHRSALFNYPADEPRTPIHPADHQPVSATGATPLAAVNSAALAYARLHRPFVFTEEPRDE